MRFDSWKSKTFALWAFQTACSNRFKVRSPPKPPYPYVVHLSLFLYFKLQDRIFTPAPGDQLLQNSPRAETQQGYVVERCVWRLFLFKTSTHVVFH